MRLRRPACTGICTGFRCREWRRAFGRPSGFGPAFRDKTEERRHFPASRRKVMALPNRLAEVAVFLVRRP